MRFGDSCELLLLLITLLRFIASGSFSPVNFKKEDELESFFIKYILNYSHMQSAFSFN